MNNPNGLWSKAVVRLLPAVLLTAAMTGCAAAANIESGASRNGAASPSGYEVSSVEPALVNLATESLDYNEEEKALLLHAAARAGLNTVYIPAKGYADDSLIEVSRWEGGVSVMFKHFTIKQP
ncbi:hypothetical protein [Paenibacillus sp. J2TS4]|uniref:hypothetical protein n=1 Tax=Paenibacillus sp. J2TS4 TaxID=2807194 RepID=UPI001B05223C|nr:hypothetical protein [Paenibacillus sp. J2TS4]GIP31324.1 hypothetical protein J2TS4_05340 [Paenibacillus sp. J2TS4]